MTTKIFQYAKKTTAITLAALCFSLPLTGIASAHGRHDAPPPRHHDRYDHYDRYDRKHKSDSYVTKKHSNQKAATSFIVGAVLGAVIAKNT
ncbi:hypothetical protein [uncultured Phascolarctobacterium sp.]|uniref:hypothetical protein n=1 Tax=uncultured Phascolarctobacterium sp. TaxID=512296 RepID=UPI0025E03AF2|nr:hypothetical protein [uncultured Phascolarctobacterium sp.]